MFKEHPFQPLRECEPHISHISIISPTSVFFIESYWISVGSLWWPFGWTASWRLNSFELCKRLEKVAGWGKTHQSSQSQGHEPWSHGWLGIRNPANKVDTVHVLSCFQPFTNRHPGLELSRRLFCNGLYHYLEAGKTFGISSVARSTILWHSVYAHFLDFENQLLFPFACKNCHWSVTVDLLDTPYSDVQICLWMSVKWNASTI